jgi:hypothetical protein
LEEGKKICRGVLDKEPTCTGEGRNDRVAGMGEGDEGAEVAEGSRDIRVEAAECPDRA